MNRKISIILVLLLISVITISCSKSNTTIDELYSSVKENHELSELRNRDETLPANVTRIAEFTLYPKDDIDTSSEVIVFEFADKEKINEFKETAGDRMCEQVKNLYVCMERYFVNETHPYFPSFLYGPVDTKK